jgi:hypothetical protein
VQNSPSMGSVTWVVLILAAISETLGQCVVLFVTSVLLSSVIVASGAFNWMFMSWSLATWIFGARTSLIEVMRVVCLAYAPLLLSFLVLLPYMGPFIRRLLYAWSFLASVIAVSSITHLEYWVAFFCTLLGWVIIEMLQRTLGRPIVGLNHWLRRVTAGVPLSVRASDLLKIFDDETTHSSRDTDERGQI